MKYTEDELIRKIASLPSFKGYPSNDFIVGVRSAEDKFNIYDDMFYHFKTITFNDGYGLVTRPVLVREYTGTTNSGSKGFLNYKKWNVRGVGLVKANEWYYDVWKYGKHRKRMDALVQVGAFKIIRRKSVKDTNTDWKWEKWKGFNFHTNTYEKGSSIVGKIKNWVINGWSVGCQVSNDPFKYYLTLQEMFYQKGNITYCLLNEF